MNIKQLLIALGLGLGLTLGLLWSVGGELQIARAAGTIRYVAITGSDSGDCSDHAHPCRTVQYAVDKAADGDEIRVAAGTYTGVQVRNAHTQTVHICRSLTLRGGYTTTNWNTSDPDAHLTTLDAQGLGRALVITGPVTVTVEGLWITNGYTADRGGGIYADLNDGRLTISHCTIVSNTALHEGGGIYAYSTGGLLTMRYSTVASNTAKWNGGGLYGNMSLRLEDNTFTNNSASGGGGLVARGPTLTMTHNLIRDNTVSADYPAYGGGAYVYDCVAWIAENTFQGNQAEDTGGGLAATWGDVTLSGNLFLNNKGGAHGGGGFYNGGIGSGHTYTITDNLFQGNTLDTENYARGGGVYIANGSGAWVLFEGNRLLDNVAATTQPDVYGGQGGGMYIWGPMRVANNLFQNNWGCSVERYGGYGGGLFIAGRSVVVEGNRFLSNVAARKAGDDYDTEALGGAVFVRPGSTVTMTNNFLANNSYSAEPWRFSKRYSGGGAISVRGNTSAQNVRLILNHNTFVSNQSAAIRNEGGSLLTMSHNIFANHDTDIRNVRVRAYETYVCPTTTMDYTLWWPAKDVDVWDEGDVCSVPATTHDFVGDPTFVGAGANDYHIGGNSAAIDKGPGVGVTTDIDGNPRPIGAGYDLGADEYANVDLSSSTKSASPQEASAGEAVTFTIVLRNTGSADSPTTLLHDPIPTATTYIPDSAMATSGTLNDAHGITWQGNVGTGQAVTITFRVTLTQEGIIENTAIVTDAYNSVQHLSAWVNRLRVYLPLVLHQK